MVSIDKLWLVFSKYKKSVAILKSRDILNAPRTATATKVIFQNHFNIISTSTVSALWQINPAIWNTSGQYAMWISQFNLTSPDVVTGKRFRYFCFGCKCQGCNVKRVATVRHWDGARVTREFFVTSRWILHGMRKLSYKAVAKTKVHICCEVAV